jgi:hypothetical protein
MRGYVAVVTVVVVLLAGCGGSEADTGDDGPVPTPETTGAASATTVDTEEGNPASTEGDAAAWIDVGGERYEFPSVIDCTFGDAFWGPDFRRFSFDTNGDFPALSVGYAPEKADDEGVEDPNVVAVYPSGDPWWYTTDASGAADMELELTADGARGSATLGVAGEGGPGGEVAATFELSCGDAADGSAGGAEGGSGDDGGDPGTPAAPQADSGTVILGGETHELSGPSRSDAVAAGDDGAASSGFDFEICETVNPAFEGEFNVAGTLGDGTPFRLSGTVGEEPGDDGGLFLGETFDEERAEGLEVSLDGRTLSGSATTSRGDIEFTFTC